MSKSAGNAAEPRGELHKVREGFLVLSSATFQVVKDVKILLQAISVLAVVSHPQLGTDILRFMIFWSLECKP